MRPVSWEAARGEGDSSRFQYLRPGKEENRPGFALILIRFQAGKVRAGAGYLTGFSPYFSHHFS
jgi:hypothetical protein